MSVRVNICGYYSLVSIHKLNLLLKNHAGISAISNRMARIRTTKIVEKGKKKISNTQDRKGAISIVVDLSWTASAWWLLTQLYIIIILRLRKKKHVYETQRFFFGGGALGYYTQTMGLLRVGWWDDFYHLFFPCSLLFSTKFFDFDIKYQKSIL